MAIQHRKEEARQKAAKQLARARGLLSTSVRHLTEAGLAEHSQSIGEAMRALDKAVDAAGEPPAKRPRKDGKAPAAPKP